MWVQYFVHHMHECGWHICKSERNDLILLESTRYYEHGIVAVVWVNPYLVVSTCQVQLGEYMCVMILP